MEFSYLRSNVDLDILYIILLDLFKRRVDEFYLYINERILSLLNLILLFLIIVLEIM